MHPATSYILDSPEPFQSILAKLRYLVERHVPDAELSMKWGLPFYMRNGKMFCFLNFRKSFVELSFPHGVLLEDDFPEMVAGENRKNLRSLRFTHPDQIDDGLIIKVLKAATQV